MPFKYPPYIFGVHDPGSWMDRLEGAGRQGWVLITELVRSNPPGRNYTQYSNRGFGVLVRLNWGYGSDGTIPVPAQYDQFANLCKAWANASPGAKAWIIGNEMNLAAERPGGPTDANKITPAMYADCYRRCRSAIHSLPGHADDIVLTAAVAPYNAQTAYDGNPTGDWVQYFSDMLYLLSPNIDGMTIHAYTHGADPNLIYSETRMAAPFNNREFHFRTYRDFARVIPAELRNLPLFLTEAQPAPSSCDADGWIPSQTRGWVPNAFGEINEWNNTPNNQAFQGLVLFRWSDTCNAWRIEDKDWVTQDLYSTMNNLYRVKVPSGIIPPVVKMYRATFLSDTMPATMSADAEVRINATLRNDSNFVWRGEGSPNPVRMGFRWFDATGRELPTREGARTTLPRDVLPGQQVALSNARIVAPPNSGPLTVRLDMVEEGVVWFSDAGSPPYTKSVTVQSTGPIVGDYAYTVTSSTVPASFPRGASTPATLTIRNDGNKLWRMGGANPVRLGFHWYRTGSSQETLVPQLVRVGLPKDVAKGDSVTLTIPVLAPFSPGSYTLLFDLVEEGVTEFHNAGATAFTRQATVAAPPYYVSWLAASVANSWTPGQTRSVTLSLRNDGSKIWPAAGTHPVRLAYYWLDRRNARLLLKQDIRAGMPRDINPGEAVDIPINILAPDSPGALTLQFDLVEEGVTFFADQGSPVLDRVANVVASQDYQVTFGDVPIITAPGAQFAVSLKLRNDGNHYWAAGGAHPVRIGYAWFDPNNQPVLVQQDLRTALPGDMAPGVEVVLTAVSFSPDKPGRYRLRWSLVEEGIAWFYDRNARTLDMTVDVARFGIPPMQPPQGVPVADVAYRAAFTALEAVTSMAPNGRRTVNIKVRNDGTKTWLKTGTNPVHVGYLWYRGTELVPVASDIRTELPSDMLPGQEASFGMQLMAPPFPDIYTLHVDVVEEGVTWFGDTGTSHALLFVVQVK